MLILGILLLAVVFIVVSSSRWHWHPLLSLLTASIGVGLAAGIPARMVLEEIIKGFGSVIGSIGIVVVLGSIVGVLLERSGAIQQLGAWMLARLGKRRPSLMLTVLGTLLGIPVFCDSGFIVLVSLAKSLSVRTGTPFPVMSLSLATGLYASHTLVPPTPGPIAAAGTLGVSDALGLVILVGILVSIPVSLIAHWAAVFIGSKTRFDESVLQEANVPEDSTNKPSAFTAFALIVTPLLLITLASLASIMKLNGHAVDVVHFVGHPVIALLITVFAGMLTLKTTEPKVQWVQQGIVQSGSIILLTGCGGA
ncbi:MAG: GntP family permease, partial [Bacteroidia bacterium]|nr:GntP family permease [Bacteroidia bacterium]